jgi:hypothetical protein
LELPVVTSRLTVEMLTAQCLARNPQAKGLSGKTKALLLEQLGVGSVWMSAPQAGAASVHAEAQKAESSQKTLSKATPPVIRKTPPNLSNVMSKVSGSSTATTVVASTSKASIVKKAPSENAQQVKPDLATSSCGAVVIVATAPANKPPLPGKSDLTTLAATGTTRKVAPTYPSTTESLDDMWHDLYTSVVKQSAIKSTSDPHGVAVCSSSTSAMEFNEIGGRATKKGQDIVTTVSLTTQGLPAISETMTIAQLKEEVKYRNPNFRGISKMKSDNLVALLKAGTAWECHADTRQARDEQAMSLHTISRAHCHPMADSATLRCRPRLGIGPTRNAAARCNRPHDLGWVCQHTVYRSCEQCDFDLCAVCFKIESMAPHEKDKELEKLHQEQVEKIAAQKWEHEVEL